MNFLVDKEKSDRHNQRAVVVVDEVVLAGWLSSCVGFNPSSTKLTTQPLSSPCPPLVRWRVLSHRRAPFLNWQLTNPRACPSCVIVDDVTASTHSLGIEPIHPNARN